MQGEIPIPPTLWPDSHWRATVAPLDPQPPILGEVRTEVAVIGGGYAGLNAAIELAQRGVQVTLLEAEQPGWGASGRNGGFCCIGGAKLSAAQIVGRVGLEGARNFRRFQRLAIDHVADVITREGIGARQGPDGEACLAHSSAALEHLRRDASEEERLYGEAPVILPREGLSEHGFAGPQFHGASLSRHGFPLHPMIYLQGLAGVALRMGVCIHGGTPVRSITAEGSGWRLVTPDGLVETKRVLIATNGYSGPQVQRWVGARAVPVLSTIFVTRPLTEAERAAQGFTSRLMSYDSRRLLHYFRHLPDGRFLFGMRGGLSSAPGPTARIEAEARRHFARLFPEWAGVELDATWSGKVCLTPGRAPFVGPIPGAPGLVAAFGWHGNGVASASLGGRLAARVLLGDPNEAPMLMQLPPPRFPARILRRPVLAVAYALQGLRDGRL